VLKAYHEDYVWEIAVAAEAVVLLVLWIREWIRARKKER